MEFVNKYVKLKRKGPLKKREGANMLKTITKIRSLSRSTFMMLGAGVVSLTIAAALLVGCQGKTGGGEKVPDTDLAVYHAQLEMADSGIEALRTNPSAFSPVAHNVASAVTSMNFSLHLKEVYTAEYHGGLDIMFIFDGNCAKVTVSGRTVWYNFQTKTTTQSFADYAVRPSDTEIRSNCDYIMSFAQVIKVLTDDTYLTRTSILSQNYSLNVARRAALHNAMEAACSNSTFLTSSNNSTSYCPPSYLNPITRRPSIFGNDLLNSSDGLKLTSTANKLEITGKFMYPQGSATALATIVLGNQKVVYGVS